MVVFGESDYKQKKTLHEHYAIQLVERQGQGGPSKHFCAILQFKKKTI